MIDTYVALDLETSGLNPKVDRITEIGAVLVENGVVTAQFETLVNPCRRLDEKIVELTGIDNEMLQDAPQLEEVLPAFLEFAGDRVLVGHMITFDYSFVKRAAVNQGFSYERSGIDTLKLSRKYLEGLESRRLGALCSYFHIPASTHRALADARAASALYLKLAELFYEEEAFAPKALHYQTKKESPITKPLTERLYMLIDKHKIVIDYEIDKLTKNEANRIIDKILASYGR